MNATRTTLSDVLRRWQRGIEQACQWRHAGAVIPGRKRGLSPVISLLAFTFVLLAWLFLGWPQPAGAATSGPNYAGAVGTNGWTNPANAVGSTETTCSGNYAAANTVGFWKSFGFAIPSTDTINGIQVEIKASWSGDPPAGHTINIGKSEATLGTAKSITTLTSQGCGAGQNIHTFGGPTDLWGLTSVTPADLNSANFTVWLNRGTAESQINLNWLRVTVYHTAPAGGTPGSFNAFETSTAAGAITGVIRTKVAGSAFSLDVVAIASGAQQSGFTDAVIVELLGNNTLGVSLDAQNCPTTSTLVQTVSPNPTITGGRSTVSFAAVPNSWRDVRVRVRWPTTSPTVTSCSTDNFAIRPNTFASFAVTDTDWQTAGTVRTLNNTGATGGNVHKAGRPFTVRADAVNGAGTPAVTTNYTGTPTVGLSDCGAISACPATFGTFTIGASFVAGQLTSNVADYSEVGSFSLQLVDSTFASVDTADGSTPAERDIASSTINVGRFVPDHFDVTSVTAPEFRTFNDAACATRSFTYIGQRFGYATIPAAMIAAKNSSGGTTTNYTGALWKLTNASASQTFANSPVMPLDTAGIAAPTVSDTAGTGTGTYTANASDAIAFVRDSATPQAPFNSNLSLTLSVSDASEAGASQGTITTTTPLVFNGGGAGIAFDSGNAFRYGRLVIRNANGSQLVPLPVQVEAQYWSGAPTNAFITNTQDSCTSIASANDAMSNYTSNLSGSPTCETAISGGGALSAGRRTLQLAAPGSGNNGSVDLTVNLGASASGTTCTTVGGAPVAATTANLPHLQGNWTGGAYNVNPSARATFGVFKGAEEVIFIRENF